MKQSKEFENIEQQMKPGIITHDGFLGTDKRKLRDIIEQDDVTVKRLGLTHGKIAARLSAFREAAVKGIGISVNFETSYEARADSARGKLPCPFQHKGLYPKTYTVIRNLETGTEIIFTDLGLHLIEEHGFYGGVGSPYRLDPETLVHELGVKI